MIWHHLCASSQIKKNRAAAPAGRACVVCGQQTRFSCYGCSTDSFGPVHLCHLSFDRENQQNQTRLSFLYCGNLFLFWIVACVTLLAEMSSDSWSRVSISWYLWTFSRPIRAWCCNFFLRKSTLNQIISFRKLPSDILVLVIFDSNFDLSFVSRYLTLLDKLFVVFRHCFCFLLLFQDTIKVFTHCFYRGAQVTWHKC